MLGLNQIYNMDCLEGMKKIPDNSVDLIIADPPYNIGKDIWDKFSSNGEYLDFIHKNIKEFERVLKDNGSLYLWHNDFQTLCDIEYTFRNSSFIFKQLIIWNKRFDNGSKKGFLDGFVVPDGLRNYQKMAEYLLYYTFQDETGLTTVKLDLNNFTSLRTYFRDFQEALGCNKKQIMEKIGQCADHCFRWGSSQWDMPTPETYQELLKLPLQDKTFKVREYEDLRREYEDLRREYEDLRYTFNNQKNSHSIWNYDIERTTNHLTQKPVPLCENIIKHSSNESDTVLIPFVGSGSECVACKCLERNFIGFELNKSYVDLANQRLKEIIKPLTAF